MLLTFLYHQIGHTKYGNPLSIFEKHVAFISENYQTVNPGDPLSFFKTDICLSFDDATKDFYTTVFPLLKKYGAKALLAVPISFVGKPGYCTWQMLQEIARSPLITIASHSYNHIDLTSPNADLTKECVTSKKILEDQLHIPISTFVYPFGKFNSFVHSFVKEHYAYIMRIGNGCNFTWNHFHKLSYRIPSDQLNHFKGHTLKRKFFVFLFNNLLNIIRGR